MAKKTPVVFKKTVPSVGAHRNGKIEIDKKLPKRDVKTVIRHERKEKKLEDKGMAHKKAHKLANKEELKHESLHRFRVEQGDVNAILKKNKDKGMSKGKCGKCGKVNCTTNHRG